MKVVVEGILHWEQWFADKPIYVIHSSDMSGCSDDMHHYAPIKSMWIETEIPDDFDPRPAIVAGLREQKQKILADSQIKANAIDEKIQQILSIEYKS